MPHLVSDLGTDDQIAALEAATLDAPSAPAPAAAAVRRST